jgi:uncharacterized SAM-binding protein YcdF (DUF218 family)
MNDDDLSTEQIAAVTAFVDIEAPPVGPTAHLIFGTNQPIPAAIVANRHHKGLAPLVIATGGINRHSGVVESREFRRLLIERGVPENVIRYESQSVNTWQNVELALPYLREAIASGLPITAVAKWYHRRAIHILRTLLLDVDAFYAVTWEPIYSGRPVTRIDWPHNADGRRRVIRESQEVPRRIAEGTFREANLINGAWR